MTSPADVIVRELAARSSFEVSVLDGWQMDSWCLFCEAMETFNKKRPTAHHELSCLWRRAVEYVESGEGGGGSDYHARSGSPLPGSAERQGADE